MLCKRIRGGLNIVHDKCDVRCAHVYIAGHLAPLLAGVKRRRLHIEGWVEPQHRKMNGFYRYAGWGFIEGTDTP